MPAMVLRIVALWLLVASAHGTAAEPTAMKIHVDRPGVKISPMLYGIFFEEINRAGDGGIYAEMIQNRSFEDDRGGDEAKPVKVPGWTLVKRQDVEATMNIDSSQPINAKNPNSLRLDIRSVAINMQHTDVGQVVNLPRFRQVRNLPHVADSLRRAIGKAGTVRVGVANEGFRESPSARGTIPVLDVRPIGQRAARLRHGEHCG